MAEIEHPSLSDCDEIEAFLEECYNHSRRFFTLRWPASDLRETRDFSNAHIIREDNRIVSLVRIFPQEAVVYDRRTVIGGIGSVSTHPDYRKKGYMIQLMNHCMAKMRQAGYAFSILGGDRQRYNFWGYETCGINAKLLFTLRSIEKTGELRTVPVERFHGQKGVLEKIKSVHESFFTYISRTANTYERIFSRQVHCYLWYTECEGRFAYLAGQGERPATDFVEIGGDKALWMPLIYSVMKRYHLEPVTMFFPAIPGEMGTLFNSCSWFSLEPFCMVKVLSLARTVDFLLGPSFPEEYTFKVRETGETYGKGRKIVELGEKQWVCALFGPFVPGEIPADIRHLFPSAFYWWLLDHI